MSERKSNPAFNGGRHTKKRPITLATVVDVLRAPWTDQQVSKLNRFQRLGHVHEFTCPNNHDSDRVLVASNDGWHCPSCDYQQDWAHVTMLRGPPNPLVFMRKSDHNG